MRWSALFLMILAACAEAPAARDATVPDDRGFVLPEDASVRLDSGVISDSGEEEPDAGFEDASADAGEADAEAPDTGAPDAGPEIQRGAIVISELQVLGNEWIELYNPTNADLEITAGTIVTSGGTFVIRAPSDPLGTMSEPIPIAAGAYAIGYPNPASGDIPPDTDFLFGAPGGATNAFADLGEVIEFRRNGMLEDRIESRGMPLVTDRSTQLSSDALDAIANDDPDAWCVPTFRDPTPGAANSSCRELVISEVTYDGAEEFVELAGPGGASLEGVVVEVGTTTIALSGRLSLDGFHLLDDVALDDDRGAIRIVRTGTVVDAFAWGDALGEGTPVPDLSVGSYPANWARSDRELDTNDNAADFFYDPSPTPGARNGAVAFSVTSIDPNDAIGGVEANVRIRGTDFTDDMTVFFGSEPASCAFLEANALECTLLHAATPERVDVVVMTRPELGATATITAAFTWTGVNNETDTPAECDYCVLQWPPTIDATAGVLTATIYGRIYEAGLTDVTAGQAPGIIAEVGYGPDGSDPTTSNAWIWVPAVFNVEYGNDDEYMGALIVPSPGTYRYTYRWSLDGGLTFSYSDLDGAGYNPNLDFNADALGTLTVN